MFGVKGWAARGDAEGPQANPAQIPWWADLCFLLAAFLFLYLILFILPGTPIYLEGNGEIYLANAKRMFEGEVIYRDFAQFTFPGTELVYFLLFKVFGPRLWIGNAMLLVLGLGLTWFTIMISRKLIPGWFSFLPALLFLTFIFRYNLDPSHHWFSVLAVMAAVVATLEERTLARLALAGALCGVAAFFTHSRGLVAVLGFAVFIVWEHHDKKIEQGWLPRGLGALMGSFFFTVVTLNAYFVWQSGLQRFLDSTVIFGVRYYPADSAWNTWRVYLHQMPYLSISWGGIQVLGFLILVHGLVPFEYVAFQIRYRRDARQQSWQPWNGLMLLEAIGVFMFLGVAPAPGWGRLSAVALPAVILFVWSLPSGGWVGKRVSWALAAGTLALMIAVPVRVQTRPWICLDLPAGHAAFQTPSGLPELVWVLEHTKPSEYFFQFDGSVTFLAGLRIPGPLVYVTSTDYTRPEQVNEIVEALEKHQVRFIGWSPYLDFPGDAGLAGDHLGPLRTYLHLHYRWVKTFDQYTQVWERCDSVSR